MDLPINGIMLINLNGQPKFKDINLVQVYAPSADSSEEDLQQFYSDIERVVTLELYCCMYMNVRFQIWQK